jgi:hypothetical protein
LSGKDAHPEAFYGHIGKGAQVGHALRAAVVRLLGLSLAFWNFAIAVASAFSSAEIDGLTSGPLWLAFANLPSLPRPMRSSPRPALYQNN